MVPNNANILSVLYIVVYTCCCGIVPHGRHRWQNLATKLWPLPVRTSGQSRGTLHVLGRRCEGGDNLRASAAESGVDVRVVALGRWSSDMLCLDVDRHGCDTWWSSGAGGGGTSRVSHSAP
jgi:hypothetical protein